MVCIVLMEYLRWTGVDIDLGIPVRLGNSGLKVSKNHSSMHVVRLPELDELGPPRGRGHRAHQVRVRRPWSVVALEPEY